MVKFNKLDKTAAKDLINKGFSSPTTKTQDTELVNAFKEMGIGDALLIPFDTSMTERSLKVQVGKAAAAAGRKVEWNKEKLDEGYVVRVKSLSNNGTPSENGAVTSDETATEEAATTSRNRR